MNKIILIYMRLNVDPSLIFFKLNCFSDLCKQEMGIYKI